MIKNLLPVFLTFSFFTAFCQDKKLFENYQNRVKGYKAVDMFLGTGGNSSNNYQGYGTNRTLGGGTVANIIAIKSTDKIYRIIQANLSGYFSFNTENTTINTNKSRQLYFSPNVNINNKWYSANNFFELGTNLRFANKAENNKTPNGFVSNTKFSDNNVDMNFTIGVGNGRLEIVTDLQNALWLAKILHNEKNINRKLTDDEINDLAKTITQSVYFRVLDGRKRIQYVLKKVDAYLQSRNVIEKTDINYFSNLNDVLFLANNFFRQEGKLKYIRLIPRVLNNNIRNEQLGAVTNKNTNSYFANEVSLRMGLEKYKPLNLYRQLEYGLGANAGYGENKITSKSYVNNILFSEIKNTPNGKRIGLDYFVRYNLYPNTRTVIGFSLDAQNGYLLYNGEKSIYSAINLSASANYFINYNTRFVLNIQENYFQNIYQSNNYLRNNEYALSLAFSAGLNISL